MRALQFGAAGEKRRQVSRDRQDLRRDRGERTGAEGRQLSDIGREALGSEVGALEHGRGDDAHNEPLGVDVHTARRRQPLHHHINGERGALRVSAEGLERRAISTFGLGRRARPTERELVVRARMWRSGDGILVVVVRIAAAAATVGVGTSSDHRSRRKRSRHASAGGGGSGGGGGVVLLFGSGAGAQSAEHAGGGRANERAKAAGGGNEGGAVADGSRCATKQHTRWPPIHTRLLRSEGASPLRRLSVVSIRKASRFDAHTQRREARTFFTENERRVATEEKGRIAHQHTHPSTNTHTDDLRHSSESALSRKWCVGWSVGTLLKLSRFFLRVSLTASEKRSRFGRGCPPKRKGASPSTHTPLSTNTHMDDHHHSSESVVSRKWWSDGRGWAPPPPPPRTVTFLPRVSLTASENVTFGRPMVGTLTESPPPAHTHPYLSIFFPSSREIKYIYLCVFLGEARVCALFFGWAPSSNGYVFWGS
jgi:hypothetical protein